MTARVSFRWIDQPSDVVVRLNGYELAIQEGVTAIFNTFRSRAESLARQIAPWMDRTGEARRRLIAIVERNAKSWALTLIHGVFYGIFLEMGTRFMGPRPAIMPALEAIQGQLMAAIRAMLGG